MMGKKNSFVDICKNFVHWTNHFRIREFVKILFQNRTSKIIFFLLFGSILFNQIYTRSQFFMPKEYKLVKKIFNNISLNNNLGERPVSIIIRAGDDMHYLMKDLGICKDKKNFCFYFANLDPYKKFRGFRARDVNYAIKQSYLHGHANATASPTGTILINRATFRVLEGKEKFVAAAIAHEMLHVMQFSPFDASLRTLKVSKEYPKKTDKELDEIFLNEDQRFEADADLGAALMLFNADYPKETFVEAMEYFYKQSGIIHTKGQSKRHPDYITRIKLIKDFVKNKSFHKKAISNASAPLRWEYNRKENWLKFYPDQINKKS